MAFAVSCVPEAVELRQAGIDKPITILQGHQSVDDLRLAEAYQLRLTIHDQRQISLLNQFSAAKQSFRFDVNLKIDTGMHRLGFHPNQCVNIYKSLKNHTTVNPDNIILMTHLACADELENDHTKQQIKSFNTACKSIEENHSTVKNNQKSIANSAGILEWKTSHADWIRPGIMLYGSSPFAETHRDSYDLKATMTLNAPVVATHSLKKGDAIGYGATFECPKDMDIAVIACGYADGYPRHATTGTPVWLNGQETQLVGRVSMDMIIVDVSEFNEPVQQGDVAEMWGENVSVDQVALSAETISYELLCNAGNLCERDGN